MISSDSTSGILGRLGQAASAEDFFALLGVDYEERIVNVARLHILRRMGQYLAAENFDGASDDDVTARCRAVLEKAYADFVASSPIDERVFKVLQDAVAPAAKPAAAFVPLSALK